MSRYFIVALFVCLVLGLLYALFWQFPSSDKTIHFRASTRLAEIQASIWTEAQNDGGISDAIAALENDSAFLKSIYELKGVWILSDGSYWQSSDLEYTKQVIFVYCANPLLDREPQFPFIGFKGNGTIVRLTDHPSGHFLRPNSKVDE
jgi:hypothetical protein